MEKVETIIYKGIEINTFYDEDCDSPDSWGNTDAFIVYDHRDFYVERKGFDPRTIFEHIQETKRMFYDGYFVFPVYAYIHSGVALSLGKSHYPFIDRWDVSFKGFALVKRQKGTYTNEKAYTQAEGLIETWNTYLSGQVYGYSSECGSCWGYYGDEGYEQMLEEAKAENDYALQIKINKHLQLLKTWMLNNVPIIYRKPMPNIL